MTILGLVCVLPVLLILLIFVPATVAFLLVTFVGVSAVVINLCGCYFFWKTFKKDYEFGIQLQNERSEKFNSYLSELGDSKSDQLIKSNYEGRKKSGYFEKEKRRNRRNEVFFVILILLLQVLVLVILIPNLYRLGILTWHWYLDLGIEEKVLDFL